MNIKVKQRNSKSFLTSVSGEKLIQNETDVNDLLSLCYEHKTNRILLYPENLTENFFDLSSQEAGNILQKFSIYRVKAALVITPETRHSTKFGEMISEANRGKTFRVFDNEEEAVEWLVKD